jgi:hypothetical protein
MVDKGFFHLKNDLDKKHVKLYCPPFKHNNQLPYMNRELRKAIYNKKMYYSKFLKDKSSKNWEQYRLRRNESIIFADVLGYIYEKFVKNFSYIYIFSYNFIIIFDKHVPTKEMYRKNNQLPYMNRELRKAIYNKKMYYSKFLKDKID